jgi:YfiR/HmsC-like
MRWRPGTALAVTLTVAALLLPPAVTAEDSAPEAALKAAFIYNFTKFVDWPPTLPANELRICTVGVSPVTEALATFDGRTTMSRALTIQSAMKIGNLQLCQLVYITDSSTSHRVAEVISELGSNPVLTVSDRDDFLDQGGMIAITRTADRLRFEVDLPSIQAAKLKIAAPLLRMAKTVRQ